MLNNVFKTNIYKNVDQRRETEFWVYEVHVFFFFFFEEDFLLSSPVMI